MSASQTCRERQTEEVREEAVYEERNKMVQHPGKYFFSMLLIGILPNKVYAQADPPTTYDVLTEVHENTGGTISPSMANLATGTEVTVQCYPDPGYQVAYLLVDDEKQEITGNAFKFTIGSENRHIEVFFEEDGSGTAVATYREPIKVKKYVKGGEVVVSCKDYIDYMPGSVVRFRVDRWDPYIVDTITVNGTPIEYNGERYFFLTVYEDTEISATCRDYRKALPELRFYSSYTSLTAGPLPAVSTVLTASPTNVTINDADSCWIVINSEGKASSTKTAQPEQMHGMRVRFEAPYGYETDETTKFYYNDTLLTEEDILSHSSSYGRGSIQFVIGKASPSGKTYDLTTSVDGGHGSISPAQTDIPEGTRVTVKLFPESGYDIDSVLINGEKATVINDSVSVYMTEDTEVVASFKKMKVLEEIHLTGSVTSVPLGALPAHMTCTSETEGVKIEKKVDWRYKLDNSIYWNVCSDNQSIEGPVYGLYVDWTLEKDYIYYVGELTGVKVYYNGELVKPFFMTGAVIIPLGPAVATDNFWVSPAVSSDGGGTISGGGTDFAPGSTHTLTLTPDEGYTVWVVRVNDKDVTDQVVGNQLVLTMDENKEVWVTFSKLRTVVLKVYPGEGSGEVTTVSAVENPYGYYTLIGPVCRFTPPPGKVFDKWLWSKNGAYIKTGAEYPVWSSDEEFFLTALWKEENPSSYKLNTTVYGGNGTASPVSGDFPAQSTQTVTFTPDAGYAVGTVTANGERVSVYNDTISVYMNENKEIVVSFRKAEKMPCNDLFVVAAKALNVRDDVNGQRIAGIGYGKLIQAKAEAAGWIMFELDGREAWVKRDFVGITYSEETAIDPAYYTVCQSAVNVRGDISTESDRIGGLKQDDQILVTGLRTNALGEEWLVIDYNGALAYVRADLLAPEGSDPESKPANTNLTTRRLMLDIPKDVKPQDAALPATASDEVVELIEEQIGSGADESLEITIFPSDGRNFDEIEASEISLSDEEGYEIKKLIKNADGSITIGLNMRSGGTENKELYNLITRVDGGNGTVSESKTDITAGTKETIVFMPDEGYEIERVTVNGIEAEIQDNTLVLTLDEDKEVVVSYKRIATGGESEKQDSDKKPDNDPGAIKQPRQKPATDTSKTGSKKVTAAKVKSPGTADHNMPGRYLALFLVSIGALAGAAVYRKRTCI